MTNDELVDAVKRIANTLGGMDHMTLVHAADRLEDLADERSQLTAQLNEVTRDQAHLERLATAMASAIGWETEGNHWIAKATNAAERWRNFEQAERHQAELQAN